MEKTKTKRPAKWRRRFLLLAMVLVGLLAAAPSLLGWTALRDRVLNAVLAEGQGTLSTSAASFGWFSSLELENLEWRDADDRPMVRLPRAVVRRSLWQLLTQGSELGTIVVENPEIEVHLNPTGSNLEDALAPWLVPSEEEPKPLGMAIEISGGRMTVYGLEGRVWRFDEVALDFSNPLRAQELRAQEKSISSDLEQSARPRLELRLKVVPLEPQAGRAGLLPSDSLPRTVSRQAPRSEAGRRTNGQVNARANGEVDRSRSDFRGPNFREGTLHVKWAPDEQGLQRLDLVAKNFPLAISQLLLARLDPTMRLDGLLSAEVHASWQADFSTASLEGLVTGKQLAFRAASLGTDTLRIETLSIPCQITGKQGRIEIEKLQATCELGEIALSGVLPAGALDSFESSENLRSLLAQWRGGLRARVDLAGLSATLPKTMQIRSDAQLTSGTIDLTLGTTAEGQPPSWHGKLLTREVAALVSGKQVAWARPIEVSMNVRADPTRDGGFFLIDSLGCRSDFLQIEGKGDAQQFDASLRFDLARLAQQLGQFLELGVLRLAGTGSGEINWSPDEGLRVGCAVQTFVFQNESFALTEPEMTLRGKGRWLPDAGRLELSEIQLNSSAVSLDINQLSLAKFANTIPQITGTFQARANLDPLSRWLSTPGQAPKHWGIGLVRGSGKFTSQGDQLRVEFHAKGENLGLWKLGIQGPQGRVGDEIVWQETSPTLSLALTLDRAADLLRIDRATLQSQTALLNLSGNIRSLSSTKDADLRGTLDYDLAAITPLLAPYLGPNIQFFGKDQATLHIEGPLASLEASEKAPSQPLAQGQAPTQRGVVTPSAVKAHWSQQLRAETTFAWEKAVFQGLPIGPARLTAKLHEGRVDFEPLDVAVLAGRVTLNPTLYLTPQAILTLEPGPIIQQVHITPEIIDQLLRYVAPVLEDPNAPQNFSAILGDLDRLKALPQEARKEGSFSVTLSKARILLDQPELSYVAGVLSVHKVRVRPGPLAQDLILQAKQIEALFAGQPLPNLRSPAGRPKAIITIDDREVPFEMVDGRIHHRGLSFDAEGITVHTSGSVGLDQTLDFLVEIPLLEKWTTGGPIQRSLKGHTIRIPVRGTFAEHQIDPQALVQLNEQLVGSAVQGAVGLFGKVLRKELGKSGNQDLEQGIGAGINTLDWLLNPKRPPKK